MYTAPLRHQELLATIGNQLSALRLQRRLTQQALTDKCGVARPSIATMLAICDALGVTLSMNLIPRKIQS